MKIKRPSLSTQLKIYDFRLMSAAHLVTLIHTRKSEVSTYAHGTFGDGFIGVHRGS